QTEQPQPAPCNLLLVGWFHRRRGLGLKAQRGADARTMNGLVTAGRPASALLDAQGVIGAADENLPAADLLEVAFQAEVGVARRQEFCIDRSVGSVAGGASFAHRFVLEDERPA